MFENSRSRCDALWACRSAIFKYFCTFTFGTLSTFWCQYFCIFTQVHFEFWTCTCNRVFLYSSIGTFTQVKNLSTFSTTGVLTWTSISLVISAVNSHSAHCAEIDDEVVRRTCNTGKWSASDLVMWPCERRSVCFTSCQAVNWGWMWVWWRKYSHFILKSVVFNQCSGDRQWSLRGFQVVPS